MRTLATTGVESEAELAFAGLHQLLRPIFDLMDGLPAPQRRALEAAFGISGESEPDPFLVALAAYQLVCDAAELSPLVLIADDAHWLDRSTLGVLSFIARRLETEPIALVAAVRAEYSTSLDEVRLPVLELGRLSAGPAAQVLDRSAPDLHPVLRAIVLAEAAGNPLALVELARTLPPSGAADVGLSAEPPAMTRRPERAFAARLEDLPEATRRCRGQLQSTGERGVAV